MNFSPDYLSAPYKKWYCLQLSCGILEMLGKHFQRCIWQSMINTGATKNYLRERRFLRRAEQLSAAIHSKIIREKLWSWLGRREREQHRHCTELSWILTLVWVSLPMSEIYSIFFFTTRSWLGQSLDGVAKGHAWLDCGHWSSKHQMKGWEAWFETPFCWSLECLLGKAPPAHQLLQTLFSDYRKMLFYVSAQ